MNPCHVFCSGNSRSISILFALALLSGSCLWADGGSSFTYSYQGEAISLFPSQRLIAVKGEESVVKRLKSESGLVENGLSDNPSLQSAGFALLQMRRLDGEKTERSKRVNAGIWTRVSSKAASYGLEIQPVFEQGGSLLIPFEEITLGFEEDTDFVQAQAFFEAYRDALGLTDIRPHRPNVFILRIASPSQGRCYSVSRALADAEGVQFAEPNHIILRSDPIQRVFPTIPQGTPGSGMKPFVRERDEQQNDDDSVQTLDDPSLKALTNWTTIAFVDFDANDVPNDWFVNYIYPTIHGEIPAEATWGYAANRKRSGTYSAYCASNGNGGVQAPGPAPINMHGTLVTGAYNLAAYEEVYLDFWFWAENEMGFNQEGQLNFSITRPCMPAV